MTKAILTSILGGIIWVDGERVPAAFTEDNGFLSLLRSLWKVDSRVMIIGGSPDYHEKNDSVHSNLKESFRLSELSVSELIMCDGRNEEMAERIPEMDVVILAGGHVPTQICHNGESIKLI